MQNELDSALGCPEFFLDADPRGFFEMTYVGERTHTARVHMDSWDSMSLDNWISLCQNFISASKMEPIQLLH